MTEIHNHQQIMLTPIISQFPESLTLYICQLVMLRYRIVYRDPAAGSSRIDDRDTTPINDDTCCDPCLLAVHRRHMPRRIT
jgi:hypothetical protein